MKKAAFTICAKNYIGLAQTLGESIKLHSPDVDYFIFVSDEFTPVQLAEHPLPDNVIIAKDTVDIPADEWYQMSFKYDLTEFATAIKPACFQYIFEQLKAGSCIFFDPDILVFSTLDAIYDRLKDHSIVLTPHITTIQDVYTGKLNEQNLFYSGMYNLGFVAVKNDEHGTKLISWWKVRLKDRCFQNKMENYFTDQKWMDFMPSFFPTQLHVSPNLGLNTAPWNFYEREIIVKDNLFFVRNRINRDDETLYPLTFVHFSGFNYKALLNNEVAQGNISNLEVFDDFEPVFTEYTRWLSKSHFSEFIKLSYTYSFFSNGVNISTVYRKLFRRLLDDGKINANPFDANGSFYSALKNGGLINDQMVAGDKSSIANVENAEGKTLLINKVFYYFIKLIGPQRFFQFVRLMRLYSKLENHVYLIDKSYLKSFKIWS